VIRCSSRFPDVAQVYARRWDIELAFRLLKDYLGLSHWWRSKQELILVQIWVVLLLSHIVYALGDRIATTATGEPFEVSVPLLVKLVPQLCTHSELSLERLVQESHQLGLLRASPRLALMVPLVELSSSRPVPPDLLWLRPGHAEAGSASAGTEARSTRIGLSRAATEASSVQRDKGNQSGPSESRPGHSIADGGT
jgi:hypothetical protein